MWSAWRSNGTKALGAPGDFQGIGRAFATRAGAGLFGGVKGTDWLFHHRDLSVSVGAAVLAVIVLAALGTGSARVRLFTLVAGCYSFVCFVTPVWLRDVAPAVARWPVQVAGRYQAVPLLLFASVVLVVADHYARDGIWSRSAVGVAGRAGRRTYGRGRHSLARFGSPRGVPGPVCAQLAGRFSGPQCSPSGAELGHRGSKGGGRLSSPAGQVR